MISLTEENYLKAIFHLSEDGTKAVLTNDLAAEMNTKAASVTDMVKRLSGKGLISYEKYYGVGITKAGKAEALQVIRKHRLWETFLVDKLNFTWDEVHDVAEQLEHIQSPLLIEKLDEFLGFPKSDPHGEAIPDKKGKMEEVKQIPLSEAASKKKATLIAVKNDSPTFLKYLSKIGMKLGSKISIVNKTEFDGSHEILIDGKKKAFISRDAAENLLVNENKQ
jgi:DtxR family transcriptional regulator, Mn-dependent transcriptional regulator